MRSYPKRAPLIAIVLACLGGCPSAEEDRPTAFGEVRPAELRADGDAELTIQPGGSETLRVRYFDSDGEPVEGVWIEFGLIGSPEGASLNAARERTDRDGLATVKVVGGRAGSGFQVRASAEGADPLYFDIQIANISEPSLTVTVAYAGRRPISSNTVLVVEGMKCEQLLTNPVEIRMSSSLQPGEGKTFMLGAGRSYAIAAWGSDDTNSKLAWGCVRYEAPVVEQEGASRGEVVIPLNDIEFMAATPIPLNFSVDMRQALTALAPLARAVVDEAMPMTSTPEASFLLDALQAKVNFSATRSSEGLDALLAERLDAASSGPVHFAEALAEAVALDGAMCLLQGTLTPMAQDDESAFTFSTPVYAVPADSVAVSLSAVPLTGATEFGARYDDATASVMITTLKIPVGFGSYASSLLDAVGGQATGYRERVSASTGCNELGALVMARPNSFGGISAVDAAATCQSAVDGLVPGIRASWATLDQQRNVLSLVGTLAAHDRDGDKVIDDLGPGMLQGAWTTAGGQGGESMLDVSVRTTAALTSLR